MFNLLKLNQEKNIKVIMLGNHPGLIQSSLDFDYLSGKKERSIIGIVGVQQKNMRYFWGEKEVLIPCYRNFSDMPLELRNQVKLFVTVQSGRRVLEGSISAIDSLPNLLGGMIFAESVPEQHAIKLRNICLEKDIFLLGPASVGLLVAGSIKLGAIGGTTVQGISDAGITEPGSIAVISSSGGMVNEIINMVSVNGGRISFAAAVGGERFPVLTPVELLKEAVKDDQTKAILYFGELGALDEYDIAEYLRNQEIGKPLICYIAGRVAEYFETPPQFGHAKSMAANNRETATAKKTELRSAGAIVADTFMDFEKQITIITQEYKPNLPKNRFNVEQLLSRRSTMFIDRISTDAGGEVKILGQNLVDFIEKKSFTNVAIDMLLGKEAKSEELRSFFDYSMKLLVDHGPQVSGAVNTMITARAGRDLATSLAAGLLTIGSRFGGAINDSAINWFSAVNSGESPHNFVERFAKESKYIPGIGHKKYSFDNPDPRVRSILEKFSCDGEYTKFAKKVEEITLTKKPQLILNVDGAIACLALDMLLIKEKLSKAELEELIRCEFFNAIFILSRSVGFAAHFIEQKRLDEGLFRLPDSDISSIN